MSIYACHEGYYCFAGITLSVKTHYPYFHYVCRNWQIDQSPVRTVESTEKEVQTEAHIHAADDSSLSIPVLEAEMMIRKVCRALLDFNVLRFHASALSFDGKGVLFTALSGVGKSTHSRMWRERFGNHVEMINDDLPLLRILDTGEIRVYGSPWMGKHHLGANTSAPLTAIAIVHRAEQNSVEPCCMQQAIKPLLEGCMLINDTIARVKTIKLLGQIAESIPLFNLYCNMTHEAAEICCQTIIYER